MMKTKLKNLIRPACLSAVLGAATLFAGGCVVHEHGAYGAYYDYYYYPEADVYFYPTASIYYWHDGGRWISGPRLPHRYVINETHRRSLRVRSQRPWEEHHRDRDHD